MEPDPLQIDFGNGPAGVESPSERICAPLTRLSHIVLRRVYPVAVVAREERIDART